MDMYSKNDYLEVLEDRRNYKIGTQEWFERDLKLNCITAVMVSNGDKFIINELLNNLEMLSDSGFSKGSIEYSALKNTVWLLESNGIVVPEEYKLFMK